MVALTGIEPATHGLGSRWQILKIKGLFVFLTNSGREKGEEALAGAGGNEAAVVAEEDVGAGVAHFVGGGGGVAAEFVGVGGKGVAENVLGPGDGGGAAELGEVEPEAAGVVADYGAGGEGAGVENGAEVGADADGAGVGGLGLGGVKGDVFFSYVGGGQAHGFGGAEPGKEADGNVGQEVGVGGCGGGVEEGLGLVEGEDCRAGARLAGEGDGGGGVFADDVACDKPGVEGGEASEGVAFLRRFADGAEVRDDVGAGMVSEASAEGGGWGCGVGEGASVVGNGVGAQAFGGFGDIGVDVGGGVGVGRGEGAEALAEGVEKGNAGGKEGEGFGGFAHLGGGEGLGVGGADGVDVGFGFGKGLEGGAAAAGGEGDVGGVGAVGRRTDGAVAVGDGALSFALGLGLLHG